MRSLYNNNVTYTCAKISNKQTCMHASTHGELGATEETCAPDIRSVCSDGSPVTGGTAASRLCEMSKYFKEPSLNRECVYIANKNDYHATSHMHHSIPLHIPSLSAHHLTVTTPSPSHATPAPRASTQHGGHSTQQVVASVQVGEALELCNRRRQRHQPVGTH